MARLNEHLAVDEETSITIANGTAASVALLKQIDELQHALGTGFCGSDLWIGADMDNTAGGGAVSWVAFVSTPPNIKHAHLAFLANGSGTILATTLNSGGSAVDSTGSTLTLPDTTSTSLSAAKEVATTYDDLPDTGTTSSGRWVKMVASTSYAFQQGAIVVTLAAGVRVRGFFVSWRP